MPDHLMGVTEIAQLLGVSRQRVQQLTKTEGFPRPAARLVGAVIWNRDEIEAWARETGRLDG